jgi:hypothetical protein
MGWKLGADGEAAPDVVVWERAGMQLAECLHAWAGACRAVGRMAREASSYACRLRWPC